MTVPESSDKTDSGAAAGTSTVTLLRKIQSDAVDLRSISVADRRQLIAFLLGDGYSTAEMSQILRVADRTVERDKKAVRESNAIARDPRLVEQMMAGWPEKPSSLSSGSAKPCGTRTRRSPSGSMPSTVVIRSSAIWSGQCNDWVICRRLPRRLKPT